MATRNAYLAYKRDTSHLLYWIIKSSNAIIRSSAGLGLDEDAPKSVNTTGEITVSSLVSLSKLIAKHINAVPPAIYRLFRSVIDARTASFAVFQQMVVENPDPETEKSNASHKRFIDALTEAFEALGGQTWNQRDGAAKNGASDRDLKEELDQFVLANKFGALGLDDKKTTGEHGDESSDEGSGQESHQAASAPQRRRQAKPGKGKKGKRGKKSKKQQQSAAAHKTPDLDDVPLESYRIIQDKGGIVTDYLMAVYALIQEWADLRAYLQGLWREVAYDGLNGAVAGAVSKLAIGMIQRSASAMFLDFPGHDSYETVMNTITRGNIEKAQGNFTMALHALGPDGSSANKVRETKVDVKEQFLIHAYRDLVDFVTDFQKTRSGKPTKRMLAEIRDWDPNFNLQKATNEQRLRWRRSYTISWLYDLVNVFSSIVVQRNTMRGEKHVFENVDWSVHGPWDQHRRLFGLNEFAGTITALAMQKPGTDIRNRILPHHVFELQCIVDSLAVSRGWSLSALNGHVVLPPPRNFRPRRDVDLFLDRKSERAGRGFLQAEFILKQLFEKDGALHGSVDRHRESYSLLEGFSMDFRDWLGESKYMYGLTDIPPSRFTNTSANGLWEYSPFLCGVGLMEGLELAYLVSMQIWDRIPEPALLAHLHNMLVQKGYLKRPVGLYSSLELFFKSAFFVGGKIPTSDFAHALSALIREFASVRPSQRQAGARAAAETDIHRIMTPDANRFFKQKTNLILYRQADWNPERIPEADIPVASMLGMIRLGLTKQTVDPATGRKRIEETDLVKRARAEGLDDEALLQISSSFGQYLKSTDDWTPPEAFLASLPKDYTAGKPSDLKRGAATSPQRSGDANVELSGREVLDLLKADIFRDVCGDCPLSSLNYVCATTVFMMAFMKMEDELAALRNPLYVRAYETDREWRHQKRGGLTFLALNEQDDECLRVMARVFEDMRTGFMSHIYWDDLHTSDERGGMSRRHQRMEGRDGVDGVDVDQCVVM